MIINTLFLNILQGAIPYSNAHFGSGSGPIWLDYLYCDGNENSLLNCSHRGIGATSFLCDHLDDVGVQCPGIKALLYVSLIPRSSHCLVFDHVQYVQAVKNWTVGRPGNEASQLLEALFSRLIMITLLTLQLQLPLLSAAMMVRFVLWVGQ